MNPQTIRSIDYWIGQPLCFLFSVIRQWVDFFQFKKGKNSEKTKKILFIKLIEQGASVLAYSAIQRAQEKVGKENLYFAVFEDNLPILKIMDVIPEKNIFVLRQKNILLFAADVAKFLYQVREAGIDTIIDMEFFSRASAILSYLSGAHTRVGLHRFTTEAPYRGDLFTHRVQYNPYLHIAKAYDLLVQSLERSPEETPLSKIDPSLLHDDKPRFVPESDQIEKVRNKVEELLGEGKRKKLVLLNPNASDLLPLRKWPKEHVVNFGKKLLENDDVCILLTGAPSEKEEVLKVEKEFSSNRVKTVAGHTTLRELFVLYTMSDLLVTNDSGPGHFSSMTDLQTIVLFGPETPLLFAPKGENIHILWKGLACSPCVNLMNHRFSPCSDNQCMKQITVDEVYQKAKEILAL